MDTVNYEAIEVIIYLGIILNLVTLICFFVLCYNVSKIKKQFVIDKDINAAFSMYISLGEYEKAKELLFHEIMKQNEYIASFIYNGNNSSQRAVLKRTFKPYFDILNIDFDFETVDKFIVALEK
ncbi:hypothetical protein [Bacteroides congonensis]